MSVLANRIANISRRQSDPTGTPRDLVFEMPAGGLVTISPDFELL